MFFPDDMNFQYLFFDTYIGYFLQVLPIVLIAAAVWYLVRFRKDKEIPPAQKIAGCTLVCYLTGLICLVALLDVMEVMWYFILYHRSGGISVYWLSGSFNLVPDLWRHINGETIGNFLMFLPFGILYPPAHPKASFRKVVITGLILVSAIEILQPVFGRAFDINDIILNTLGVIASAAVFMLIRNIIHKNKTP